MFFLFAYLAVIFFLFASVLAVYFSVRGVFSVPWIRSRRVYTKAMLDLAEVKPGDRVVDFGSGDGSIIFHAIKNYGATGVGYEQLFALVFFSRLRSRWLCVSDRASFFQKDFLSGEV